MEPVQETVEPVVEPVQETVEPVVEPVVGSPQGGPPQGPVTSGPTEQGALTPADPAAALAPASGQVSASGAPAKPAALDPPYGVPSPGDAPRFEEGVSGQVADAPVASRPMDLSASLGAEQASRVFDAALPAASSSTVTSEGLMVSPNGHPAVGKQIPGTPGAIENIELTRLFASILADVYAALSSTSAAGDALSSDPASGSSPVPAAPASPAGLGSAFGGSGFGGASFLLGALAFLFVFSPAGGRLLRSLRDFLEPTSALQLAIERPG